MSKTQAAAHGVALGIAVALLAVAVLSKALIATRGGIPLSGGVLVYVETP